MVNTYRNIEVTISGSSDEDVRNQAKQHFGFVDQEVQVRDNKYHVSKLQLVKMLREFDKKNFGYLDDNGNLHSCIGLMDTMKFVEEYLGEQS